MSLEEPVNQRTDEIQNPYGLHPAGRNALTGASRIGKGNQILDQAEHKYIARVNLQEHLDKEKSVETASLHESHSKHSTPAMTPKKQSRIDATATPAEVLDYMFILISNESF